MKYGYTVLQYNFDGELYWVAESADLKGCLGQGKTVEEAVQELKENEIIWLETAKEYKIAIPKSTIHNSIEQYSGKLTLRLGKTLHKNTAERAESEGVSLNQYILTAITNSNAGLAAADIATRKIEENTSFRTSGYKQYTWRGIENTGICRSDDKSFPYALGLENYAYTSA